MVLKSLLHLAAIYIYLNLNPEHHHSLIALHIKKYLNITFTFVNMYNKTFYYIIIFFFSFA